MQKKLLHLGLVMLPFLGFGQVVLTENFNAATLPATWTVQQTNANESWETATLASGATVAAVNYDATLGQQNEWLISPSVSLANAAYYYLKFKVGLSEYWAISPNNNYDAFVKISTDNGVTWTQLWTETNLTSILSNFGLNAVSLDISAYKNTPNVKIAFQYVGSDGAALYIDDVSIEGSSTQQLNYCGPLDFVDFFGDQGDEPITLVNFAGINNITDNEPYIGNSHEFFLDQTATVTQGQSYNITLKGNTGGDYENRFAVFIDWNQNGILNDEGEVYQVTQTIEDSDGTDAVQAVQAIAVPSTALTGNTRMRVKKIYGTASLTDPCAGSDYGQAEDYTVNVVAAPLAVTEAHTKNSSFKAYPNPVHDILNIDSQAKVKSISIIDLSGKTVLSSEINQNQFNINLSRLSSGAYILSAQTENGLQSVKVIKK